MKKANSNSFLAENRKASFDVSVEETFEAGLVLTGDEIKSIRARRAQMTGSYVKFLASRASKRSIPQAVIIGMHLAGAEQPERSRPVLLSAKELQAIKEAVQSKGNVVVPLKLYIKHGWAKVLIGLGTGRKARDKRNLLRSRDIERETNRTLKAGK